MVGELAQRDIKELFLDTITVLKLKYRNRTRILKLVFIANGSL
jgi:hypothetical protein